MFSEVPTRSTQLKISQIVFVSTHQEAFAHAQIGIPRGRNPDFSKYVALGTDLSREDEAKILSLVTKYASESEPNVTLKVQDALPLTEEGYKTSIKLGHLLSDTKLNIGVAKYEPLEGSCWMEYHQGFESKQFTTAQIDYLNSQGIRPEAIPDILAVVVKNQGEGQMMARNLDTKSAVCWFGASADTVVVSSLHEALAYAQEHPSPSTYIATGKNLSPEGLDAIGRWLNNNHGDCRIALPDTAKGHKQAWLITEKLGKETTFEQDLPTRGKSWSEQVRLNNPDLVRSAPAKYRDRELER